MNRKAYLAGRWYPDGGAECRAAIEAYEAPSIKGDFAGIIAPHAGWTYSGACAAHTYAVLGKKRDDAELVVLFGSHRGPHGPNTVFRDHGWETPLGVLETDTELADAIAKELSIAEEPARPSRPDNAVEVHLPFVRHFFPRARFVMLGVAAAEIALDIGRRVGEMVRDRGGDAVFVGSTDLTHYGPNYDFSPAGGGERAVEWVRAQNDAGFVDAVLADDPKSALAHAVQNQSACCPGAAVAAMEAARAVRGKIAPALVEHYLSYDVRPDSSFVGYAGLAF